MADTKITALTAVVTPDNADVLPVVQDTSGTPTTKKITWTVIKAFLKTYFDTLYEDVDATILRSANIGSSVQAYDADLAAIAAIAAANGDILYYNSGWQKLAKGSDAQVLTLASGIPSWAAAAGGSDSKAGSVLWDIEENRRVSTRTGGTGFVDVGSSALYLFDTGSTSGSVAGRYGSSADVINDFQGFLKPSTGWQNDFFMETSAKLYVATAQDAWFGFCDQSAAATFNPASGAVSSRHACFFVYDAQIIASSGSGSAQTTTNVSGDATLLHAYRIEVDYNASATRFYVDDVLVATHTTNRPTTTNAIAPVFGIINNAAAEKAMSVSRIFEVGTLV